MGQTAWREERDFNSRDQREGADGEERGQEKLDRGQMIERIERKEEIGQIVCGEQGPEVDRQWCRHFRFSGAPWRDGIYPTYR